MSLLTEVQSRYSNQVLVALTNPNATEIITLDTTATGKLNLACLDVQADFETELGRVFDIGRQQDISVAVEGVIAKLVSRTEQTVRGEELHEAFISRLRRLSPLADPHTTSQLTPIDERRGLSIVRPGFDDSHFDRYNPEVAGTGLTFTPDD
jgi:hypothetical protein